MRLHRLLQQRQVDIHTFLNIVKFNILYFPNHRIEGKVQPIGQIGVHHATPGELLGLEVGVCRKVCFPTLLLGLDLYETLSALVEGAATVPHQSVTNFLNHVNIIWLEIGCLL